MALPVLLDKMSALVPLIFVVLSVYDDRVAVTYRVVDGPKLRDPSPSRTFSK